MANHRLKNPVRNSRVCIVWQAWGLVYLAVQRSAFQMYIRKSCRTARTQVNVDSRVLSSSEKTLASQAGSAPKCMQSQRLIRKQEEHNPTQPQPQARHNSLRIGPNLSIFGLSRPTEKTQRSRQTDTLQVLTDSVA
ncbi:hypothetical protein BKA59DRAFT_453224 [Fusarium tricinctum]|uniref:Uncharacterized protein n=1 Tax=Fusarium tricinctum TaxID=61284 RepID=A0A8K0WE98_9HYPO|nr:hypothetical protein BKA59DRAFT_453224 [Fusarium tricinctum]